MTQEVIDHAEPSEAEWAMFGEMVTDELATLRRENMRLQRRIDELMNEKAEVIRHAKGIQRQLDKLRKING